MSNCHICYIYKKVLRSPLLEGVGCIEAWERLVTCEWRNAQTKRGVDNKKNRPLTRRLRFLCARSQYKYAHNKRRVRNMHSTRD